ncbi:trihelix transcription factor GT-3b-like [Euphorbia lathyris]|uniref:trihelix transcription factor GT-3b-like n=1 Tax=Euphorbia lathyris TaxID=212925 RepID=UPI003313A676
MEGQHQHHQISETADRFPQWSIQETKEFLMIRSELDGTFMETKRNKLLWEVISNKMKEKGFFRSSEQCKCKWKNLVTRYKGCETMEPESLRQQFPFYKELQGIFGARMQRMLCGSKKKAVQVSSEDEEDESEEEQVRKKKKKKGRFSAQDSKMKEILGDFMKQQMQIEMQWMEAFESRENERRVKEMEWRQTMEALENERIMMDTRWRQREEERNIRQEARAEKRDALITALLNNLT